VDAVQRSGRGQGKREKDCRQTYGLHPSCEPPRFCR
jgi:hypothetical protein